MIGSAAAVLVLWTVAQAGAPDGGAPVELSGTSMMVVDAGTPATSPEAPAAQASDGGTEAAGETPLLATPDAGTPADTTEGSTPPRSSKPKPTKKTYLKRPNTASFNVANAVFGSYGLALERALSPHVSIVLEAFLLRHTFPTPRGTTTVNGFGFSVIGRYFLFGNAPDGLYVAPALTTYNLSVREQSGNDSGTTLAFGAEAGYSWTFFNWLHVSPGIGGEVLLGPVSPAGIQFYTLGGSTAATAVGYGFAPRLRLNVGFSF